MSEMEHIDFLYLAEIYNPKPQACQWNPNFYGASKWSQKKPIDNWMLNV
jgi:hypothetical protein